MGSEMCIRDRLQLLASGLVDRLARKTSRGYVALAGSQQSPQILYVHPLSCLWRPPASSMPDFVCYLDRMERSGGTAYIGCLSVVSQSWIPGLLRSA